MQGKPILVSMPLFLLLCYNIPESDCMPNTYPSERVKSTGFPLRQDVPKDDRIRNSSPKLRVLMMGQGGVRNEAVILLRNGRLRTVESGPDIYSKDWPSINIKYSLFNIYKGLIRERRVSQGKRGSPSYTFTLESVAIHRKICMNEKGKLFTIKSKRNGRRRRGQAESSKRKKLEKKEENCYFKYKSFPTEYFHEYAFIYSATHSNASTGLFLRFRKNGTVKGVPHPLNKPPAKSGMIFHVGEVNNSMLRKIFANITFFPGRGIKFNEGIRNCFLNRTFSAVGLELNLNFTENQNDEEDNAFLDDLRSIHRSFSKFIKDCKKETMLKGLRRIGIGIGRLHPKFKKSRRKNGVKKSSFN